MKRGQREDALDQWAEKHGLSAYYKKYKNATDIAREDRQKALMDILEKLPVFFAKLESIETDKSLTCDEENEAIRKLCSTVDARGRRAADYLLGLYHVQPHYTVKPKRASSFHDLILEDLANSAVDVNEFFTW
ncbi:hypothetical protein OESDEN_13490 [Oesophagostomum dentatum]|uniref:SXP/RAL-2 family protein Ani s 5-like cation-binding domain-containing protein n=1 Tax=Oesophagostomum dentatum TaxID=61180 RepID=A0A0B1SU88_OESDE|nr:hypothetical protein OESDEN_13490 [Oesophagostomum dentatum]